MPLAKLAQINTELSGRLGTGEDALVYYTQAGRTVVRSYVQPKQPDTPAQRQSRAGFRSLGAAWRALSRSQGAAWAELARQWLLADPELAGGTLHAQNAFQKVNQHRLAAGQPLLADPPALALLPAPQALLRLAVDPSGQTLRLSLNHFCAPGAGWWRLCLTPPLPSEMCQAKHNAYRLATSETGQSYLPIAATPQTLELPLPLLRYPPQPGDGLGLELLPLSQDFVPHHPLRLRYVLVEAD